MFPPIPQMTSDELVEFGQQFYETLAARAQTYAEVALEGSPRDAVLEGFAFTKMAAKLVPVSGLSGRVFDAWLEIHRAEEKLAQVLYATGVTSDG